MIFTDFSATPMNTCCFPLMLGAGDRNVVFGCIASHENKLPYRLMIFDLLMLAAGDKNVFFELYSL
jgi:hypothetical protein